MKFSVKTSSKAFMNILGSVVVRKTEFLSKKTLLYKQNFKCYFFPKKKIFEQILINYGQARMAARAHVLLRAESKGFPR